MDARERLNLLLGEAQWAPLQPWRPRFSSAGDCLRLLVYEAVEAHSGARPDRVRRPVRWNAANAAGAAVGALIEAAAVRLGAQVQVSVQIGNVTGTADIVWDDAVWDTKLLGEWGHWQAFRTTPDRYVLQVAGYAAVLGKSKYAVLSFGNAQLGKGEVLDVAIDEKPTPPDAAERIVAIWDTVEAYRARGELPPHGYAQDKCKKLKCRFLEECWS